MISQYIEGVCLGSLQKRKEQYAHAIQMHTNFVSLYNPEEVKNTKYIRFALAWDPQDDVFKNYPNLEIVSSVGAGVDSILRCSSLSEKIIVTRTCDNMQAYELACFAAWHVVWHQRNMKQYFVNMYKRKWQWVDRMFNNDCTVGILGFGFMGKAVATALSALGYQIIVAKRNIISKNKNKKIKILSGPNSIYDVAKQSNILINLLPLTKETINVLNANLFQLMPRGGVLIQLGRGEHLIEKDLIRALENGWLSAVSIDVFRQEPLPKNHQYWNDPRILVTPHDSSESHSSTVAYQFLMSLSEHLAGKLPKLAINRKMGY